MMSMRGLGLGGLASNISRVQKLRKLGPTGAALGDYAGRVAAARKLKVARNVAKYTQRAYSPAAAAIATKIAQL